jgi:hypothetical protein
MVQQVSPDQRRVGVTSCRTLNDPLPCSASRLRVVVADEAPALLIRTETAEEG